MAGIVFTNWRQGTRARTIEHVLVMDTDVDMLAILGQLLSDEEYDVSLVCHRALSREIDELGPDVIIAAPSLIPTFPSSSYPSEIPTRDLVGTIPIIYCTIDPYVAAELRNAGCTTLLKPFDLEDVLNAILQAIPSGR